MTPSECRSAYASYLYQSYLGIPPHRRRGLENRLALARQSNPKVIRWICRVIKDWIEWGP